MNVTDLRKLIPGVIAVLLIFVLGLVIVLITAPKPLPQVSNPDSPYLTVGDKTITMQELYHEMKSNTGITELLDIVDHYLLADEILAVDPAAVQDAINVATYGTEDWETELTAEEQAEKEAEFARSLYLAGFYTEQDISDFYYLEQAKVNYVKALLAEDETVVGETKIAQYYDDNYPDTVCGLQSGFFTKQEAINTLEHFGVMTKTLNEVSEFVWIPVDENGDPIPSDDENYPEDDALVILNEAEVLKLNIDVYNYMHQYNEPLSAENGDFTIAYTNDGKVKTLSLNCDFEDERTTLDYEEMKAVNASLANYVYNTLDTDVETTARNFNAEPLSFGYYYITYKVDTQENSVTLAEANADIVEALIDNAVGSRLNSEILKLRNDSGFVIYDEWLELEYSLNDFTYNVQSKYSKTLVAKVGDYEITPDMLFAELEETHGVNYAADMMVDLALYDSPFYDDLTSEDIEELKDQVEFWKTNFAGGAYAQNGFPPTFGWENFLFVNFKLTNEQQVVDKYLIPSRLTNDYVTDNFVASQADMQAVLDEYFKMSATHMIIRLDKNLDDKTDVNYDEYTTEEIALVEQLKDLIVNEVNSNFDSSKTDKSFKAIMEDIVSEYKNANRHDSVYAPFKNAGLALYTEELAAFENGTMVTEFNDAMKSVWNTYNNSGTHGDVNYMNDAIIGTQFGYHVVAVKETFEAPAAEYDDDDVVIRYLPTDAEIVKYMEQDLEDLSDDVKAALTKYYDPAFGEVADFSSVKLAMYTEFIISGTPTWTDTTNGTIFTTVLDYLSQD